MKHQNTIRKRCFAALLSLTTAISVCTVGISAFAVREDNILYETSRPLSDGLDYRQILAEENGFTQEGYLFSYRGGLSTVPVVTYGEEIRGRESLPSMAQLHADSTGTAVVGGTNGDFFSMATGIPMGIMIDNGTILSSDAGENAIGIREDGRVLIGNPSIGVTLHKETFTITGSLEEETAGEEPTDAGTVSIRHINKNPAVWGAYLLTPAYGNTTRSQEKGREIVFRLEEGAFTLHATENETPDTASALPPENETKTDGTIRASVIEVRENVTDGAIPTDGFVIVVHNQASDAADFADLHTGDTVSLSLTAADGWEDVVFAIGGGDILVSDGTAETEDFKAEHAKTRNPRTAIGYTEDGTVRIFTVDGRTAASRGMTLAELAETMRDFGCIGALNLDGGGSATVLIRESDGVLTVQNAPTDGNARGIGNAILFVNTAVNTGETPEDLPFTAVITPNAPIVYRDTPVTLSVSFLDKQLREITVPDAVISWSTDNGEIDASGRLTGHTPKAGIVRVTADIRIPLDTPITDADGVTVSEKVYRAAANVYKTDTLDTIVCDTSAITVVSGGKADPITLRGRWHGREVLIDAGHVHAAFVNAENPTHTAWGYIDSSLTVHNTLTAKEATALAAGSGFKESVLTLSVTDAAMTHTLSIPVTFGAAAKTVLDMEQHDLRTMFRIPDAGSGSYTRLLNGGRNGTAALVVSAQGIAPVETPQADNPVKRMELYLCGELPVNAYLRITANGESRAILWEVADDFTRINGWKRLTADLTTIAPDGIRDFSIDDLLGSPFAYTVTLDDLIYHYGDDVTPFTDIVGSWAEDSILTAARMGAVSGILQQDGTFRFDPSGALTRAAFAKMICVFAGLTPVETPYLPFADADSIPEWAAPYIRAVTDAGYMRGKTDGQTDADGNPITIFAADDTMTRAEVLQVLGTLIRASKGDAAADTAAVFADDAEIPDWARDNIGCCVHAGIITGFGDNTIRPTAEITRAEIAALLVRTNHALN